LGLPEMLEVQIVQRFRRVVMHVRLEPVPEFRTSLVFMVDSEWLTPVFWDNYSPNRWRFEHYWFGCHVILTCRRPSRPLVPPRELSAPNWICGRTAPFRRSRRLPVRPWPCGGAGTPREWRAPGRPPRLRP